MDADAVLVDGLKAGDTKVQEEFWERYWSEVYGICAHILGSGPDATDVAVDLLLDFMTDYVQRLSHPGALRSYLRLMSVRRSLRFPEVRWAVRNNTSAVCSGTAWNCFINAWNLEDFSLRRKVKRSEIQRPS